MSLALSVEERRKFSLHPLGAYLCCFYKRLDYQRQRNLRQGSSSSQLPGKSQREQKTRVFMERK